MRERPCCAGSTCTSLPARSSPLARCRTAPARPRRCGRSPASSAQLPRARCRFAGEAARLGLPGAQAGSARHRPRPRRPGLFFGLTVAEHLRVGYRGEQLAPDSPTAPSRALAALQHRRAGLLSGGEQQMLAIGRALARRPRLLLLDELSLGPRCPWSSSASAGRVRSYAKDTGLRRAARRAARPSRARGRGARLRALARRARAAPASRGAARRPPAHRLELPGRAGAGEPDLEQRSLIRVVAQLPGNDVELLGRTLFYLEPTRSPCSGCREEARGQDPHDARREPDSPAGGARVPRRNRSRRSLRRGGARRLPEAVGRGGRPPAGRAPGSTSSRTASSRR